MRDFIDVTYTAIKDKKESIEFLARLNKKPLLAFDTESRSIYTPEDRAEAEELLKSGDAGEYRQMAHMVLNSSGLSYPEITKTTHFVFSDSISHSTVLVCDDVDSELRVWHSLANYRGKLIVHNFLFDIKTMYLRTGKLPVDFEDTQLMVKSLTNHVDIWRAKVGLKDLMAAYYDPSWGMVEDYEPKDLMDPKFLLYAATDGAACFNLYHTALEYFKDFTEDNLHGS